MHSILNLLKTNKDLTNQKTDIEKFNLAELRVQLEKYKKLSANKKLLENLNDRGERINSHLKRIEELIGIKESQSKNVIDIKQQSVLLEERNQGDKDQQVDVLMDKFENLLSSDKTEKKDQLEDKENKNTDSKDNYFAKVKSSTNAKSASKKVDPKLDENKYKEVKEKVLNSMNNRPGYKSTKMIPIDACFKLLKEHEKRIQEFQMKQAAEKLLEGHSVAYDYSFLNTTNKENLRYRETAKASEFKNNDDDDYDNDEVDDELSDDYSDDNYDYDDYSNGKAGSKIDSLHRSEIDRFKYKNDDLEKID